MNRNPLGTSPAPRPAGTGRLDRHATDAMRSRGRLHPDDDAPTRTPFQRDRDRVVHCAAFRRLKHKTQVFVEHEGDHYRTRLTHTIEVAQIARSLARGLALDEDLAEALSLAHDLGHTPFGHAGERALDAAMLPFGGFDHNAQSLRVVTRLERRYARFDGLNLAWETLEGLVKHNGPLVTREGAPLHGPIPGAILEFDAAFPLDLWSQPGPEAQVAALADDIAYDAHDIDDALRAGLLSLDDLGAVPFLGNLLAEVRALHPGLEEARVVHEITRRVITGFVLGAMTETSRRLEALGGQGAEAVRASLGPVAVLPSPLAAAQAEIKGLLTARVYRHPRIDRIMGEAAGVVSDLFARFVTDPSLLPDEWRRDLPPGTGDEARRARRVADYIAGMTDRYALEAHRRLFDRTPALR